MTNKLSIHSKESYFYPTLKKGKALEPISTKKEDKDGKITFTPTKQLPY